MLDFENLPFFFGSDDDNNIDKDNQSQDHHNQGNHNQDTYSQGVGATVKL